MNDVVVPLKVLDDAEALEWLRAQPGARTTLRPFELAARWGWPQYRVNRRLGAWVRDGIVVRRGNSIAALLSVAGKASPEAPAIAPANNTTIAADPEALQFVESAQEKVLGEQAEKHHKKQLPKVLGEHPQKQVSAVLGEQVPAARLALGAPNATRRPTSAWRAPAPHDERGPGSRSRAAGRVSVGLAIVGTGAWIAYTSMRGNAWFGHSLTPDPTAGEIYSTLSVAAEVIACLIPTGIRFYWQNGEAWSAIRGWALMAVALVVVFFAAGGFAITNINSGVEARAERENPTIRDLRNQLAGLERSIASECVKRGDRCRDLERQRADANAKLGNERASLKADADPQAAALGVSSATLHLIQGGAMVALCLFSGLFISFGAGLIWPRGRTA